MREGMVEEYGLRRYEVGIDVFFFSSRRRHTRSKRDWSSDVCSSDLPSQEGPPSLGRGAASLDHVLRDARLSDLETELEQLTMDAWCSPQRIFRAHLPDQRAQVRGDPRSASKRARFPTPVPAEAGSMPTDKGLRSDDRDGLQDRWKPSIQVD